MSWATFIANHAGETWAGDFVQTHDLFFRAIFVYFIVEPGSRRVVHYGVTRSASDFWVAQQVRDATPFAICERFIGSVRRECLDHILILSARHLYQVIGNYVNYFNHARPHQGIGQWIPDPKDEAASPGKGNPRVIGKPVLGGLHHDYRRVA